MFSYCLILSVGILVNCNANSVPVLIWKSDGSMKSVGDNSVFAEVSADNFYRHFTDKFSSNKPRNKPIIVVFMEETLSVEDFSHQGSSSYPFLSELTSTASIVDFLPSVQTPMHAFKRMGYKLQELKAGNIKNSSLQQEGGVVLVVHFDDSGFGEEARSETLKRHDQTMYELYNSLSNHHHHVIGVYTSESLSRDENEPEHFVARKLLDDHEENYEENYVGDYLEEYSETEINNPNGTLWCGDAQRNFVFMYLHNDSVLVFNNFSDSSSRILITESGNFTSSVTDLSVKDFPNLQLQTFTINFTVVGQNESNTLDLKFYLSNLKYWKLEEIEVWDEVLKPTSEIFAPVGFSYHCSDNITFVNSGYNLTVNRTQFQAFVDNKTDFLKFKFADAYDCVPFYTTGILSGLMITVLMILITMWGLSMIMDIRTNDLYDDPKGKTITVVDTDFK